MYSSACPRICHSQKKHISPRIRVSHFARDRDDTVTHRVGENAAGRDRYLSGLWATSGFYLIAEQAWIVADNCQTMIMPMTM